MKKQILSLGKALNKAEQKQINGGNTTCSDQCSGTVKCPTGQECFTGTCLGKDTKMCRTKQQTFEHIF